MEVREYEVWIADYQVVENIEIQALSAQNAADLVRKIYGPVEVFKVCEVRDDWK